MIYEYSDFELECTLLTKIIADSDTDALRRCFPALFYSDVSDATLRLYKALQFMAKNGGELNFYEARRISELRFGLNPSYFDEIIRIGTDNSFRISTQRAIQLLRTLLAKRLIARRLQKMQEILHHDFKRINIEVSKLQRIYASLTAGVKASVDSLIDETIQSIKLGTSFIPTGHKFLNDRISGLTRGQVSGLIAMQSHMKSTYTDDLAYNTVMKTGQAVTIFSLEDPATERMKRIIAAASGIELNDLRFRRPNIDKELVQKIVGPLNNKLIIFDTRQVSNIEQIEEAVLDIKPDIFIVDYLQCLGGEDMVLHLIQVINRMSRLTRLTSSHGIVCSQVPDKSLQDRRVKVPTKSDVRWTSALTDAASEMFSLYYSYVDTLDPREQNSLTLQVTKAKFSGWLGRINLIIDPKIGKIIGEREAHFSSYIL